jgi:hypothetical protein
VPFGAIGTRWRAVVRVRRSAPDRVRLTAPTTLAAGSGSAGRSGKRPQASLAIHNTLPQSRTGTGYWTVDSDGGVFAFGGAPSLRSEGGRQPGAAVVGIASGG